MAKKDLLSIYDLSAKEIKTLLNKAFELKARKKHLTNLNGKTLGLIFEKPSTRTMVSFAAAMVQLGGTPILLNAQNLQRKRGESIHDTALALSKYLNCLMIRAFKHSDVEEFAKYSSVPVINGLTDYEHPCQVLADIMTMMELHKLKSAEALKKIKIVFIGDSNNVANSLLAVSAVLGLDFTLICPKEFVPEKSVLDKALKWTSSTGAQIMITSDIEEAKNADVIYTDVWTSMGAESEEKKRKKAFAPYQVNTDLMKKVSSKCIVLHCLPAVRGEEVTAEIMDKYENSIFTQAENRLHAQKAVLLYLLN
ncbi:MAG: ornithine carbamoyltransferase [Endomicrobia bacterium]|nr:ornithine carbamoyltransferase [Endomicrobiia bacterium]MCL2799464.1 ornithine carbamoyltransferase [Endomicrobiia bacterium]